MSVPDIIKSILDMIYVVFKIIILSPIRLLQMLPDWLVISLKIIMFIITLFLIYYFIKNRDEWKNIDC